MCLIPRLTTNSVTLIDTVCCPSFILGGGKWEPFNFDCWSKRRVADANTFLTGVATPFNAHLDFVMSWDSTVESRILNHESESTGMGCMGPLLYPQTRSSPVAEFANQFRPDGSHFRSGGWKTASSSISHGGHHGWNSLHWSATRVVSRYGNIGGLQRKL